MQLFDSRIFTSWMEIILSTPLFRAQAGAGEAIFREVDLHFCYMKEGLIFSAIRERAQKIASASILRKCLPMQSAFFRVDIQQTLLLDSCQG
jgi:hypothetical protein